jgi:hypothetical protein
MKICVTMVGVCRPTFERVKENIEKNILYFTSNYPTYSFTFMILAYKNKFFPELSQFCKDNNIKGFFIEHLEEKDFIFPVKIKNPNIYRLFYSMSYILEQIPKDVYDCIVRLRIDTEVKDFELFKPEEEIYYCLNENNSGRCSSNVGYARYDVMRNVWKHSNCLVKGSGEECVVFNSVSKYKYKIKPFKFHIVLYQSPDIMFDGVAQWSKKSREWIYDGDKYILKDI